MQADSRLLKQMEMWRTKPALRSVYNDYFAKLEVSCPGDRLLDIGSGSSHFRSLRKSVVSLDILPCPGVDVIADAHQMPFGDGSFDGIVMLDVLHHLQRPVIFFREAARVLAVGGRVALIEPAMTPIARFIYDTFHHEPVLMNVDPFDPAPQSSLDPFDSNQAIPSLMFGKASSVRRFEHLIPELRVVSIKKMSLFAYPLSGGYSQWSLISGRVAKGLLGLEQWLEPIIAPLMGFRILIVLERN